MKKQIKISLLIMLLLISTTVLVKKTSSSFTSKDDVNNIINIGDVDIEVSEKFTIPENWDGKEYPKIVQIENKSKSKALIRVAILPRWVDKSGNTWAGDTKIVVLNYENKNIIASPSTTPKDKWVDGKDGYYYYNTIVPMEDTTVAILNSVSASIPENLKERYKDKTLIVDVKAEAVQATNDAYKKTWSNINNNDLLKMLDDLCNR